MDSLPAETPNQPVSIANVGTDRYCIKCAYPLVGLAPEGNCPECGTSIALSLGESTLANASPEYLATILRGVSFVLNGILIMLLFGVAATIAAFTGMSSAAFVLGVSFASLVVSGIILAGYYLYTEPDPGQVAKEATHSARAIIRITVIVQAALAVASTGLEVVEVTGSVNSTPVSIAKVLVGIAGTALWAVQFFCVMRYTRWIATRVPDFHIIRRTKTYMWLLPVIYVPGALLVVGPLIALVLYWNLLDRLRKHLKSIVKSGTPAKLKGMLATGK